MDDSRAKEFPDRLSSGDAAAVALRRESSDDGPFLFRLYCTTREDAGLIEGFGERERKAFLLQQFKAQQFQFPLVFPLADFLIIMHEDGPIGRLYVNREKERIEILDITLLPEYRCRGIGSGLLSLILREAYEAGSVVCLKVAWFNSRARILYERMGFHSTGDDGAYTQMEWNCIALRGESGQG